MKEKKEMQAIKELNDIGSDRKEKEDKLEEITKETDK